MKTNDLHVDQLVKASQKSRLAMCRKPTLDELKNECPHIPEKLIKEYIDYVDSKENFEYKEDEEPKKSGAGLMFVVFIMVFVIAGALLLV